MGLIPESTIQEIRDRIDIVGLIGRYVELKRAGRNFKGLCPFHGEKTPSFNVNPDRQIFHCFGCHEGGDVIGFLIKHDGLSFPEAVRSLAAECGIEIQESSGQRRERGLAESLHGANAAAQALYTESLHSPDGQAASDYLKGRGLDDEAIARHNIGYAPDRWDAVAQALAANHISADVGERAGLLAPRKGGGRPYDRLRGRITFPIHDVRGRVVGFGGRALGEGQEPKYLNTPETPIFRKRQTFYGFPDALAPVRSASRAIICEGYFDRIALARADLGEALATCGTALTPEHATQLRRRTDEIVLLFDGDEAGRQAMERSLQVLLPEGLRVRAVLLPKGEDPHSVLEQKGAQALRDQVDSAQDALERVMQRAVEQGCASPTQKADVVNRIVPLLVLIPDSVERIEYARRLANWTGVDEAPVQAAVRAGKKGSAPTVAVERIAPRRVAGEERHLHELAVLILRAPFVANRIRRASLEALLPAGSWQAVLGAMLDAVERLPLEERGQREQLDQEPGEAGGREASKIDLFALEQGLDEDARARLREVAVDEELFRGDLPALRALEQLLGRLEKRRIDALQKELTRKMSDPEADIDAVLREKKRLREQGLGLLLPETDATGGPAQGLSAHAQTERETEKGGMTGAAAGQEQQTQWGIDAAAQLRDARDVHLEEPDVHRYVGSDGDPEIHLDGNDHKSSSAATYMADTANTVGPAVEPTGPDSPDEDDSTYDDSYDEYSQSLERSEGLEPI